MTVLEAVHLGVQLGVHGEPLPVPLELDTGHLACMALLEEAIETAQFSRILKGFVAQDKSRSVNHHFFKKNIKLNFKILIN